MTTDNSFFSSAFADLKLDSKIARTAAEAEWLLDQVSPQPAVLDLGCGRGRLSIELAKRGALVTAVDINPEYLQVAQTRSVGLHVDWRQQDERYLDDVDRFDLVVSAFTSFGYHTDEENERVVARIARALKVGGVFVVETTNRDARGQLEQTATVERPHGEITILKEYAFDPLTSRRHMEFSYLSNGLIVDHGSLTFRMYSLHELVTIFATHGLEFKSVHENVRGDHFRVEGEHLTVVARKVTDG